MIEGGKTDGNTYDFLRHMHIMMMRLFEQDREALLNSMEAHGIGHIVNACASIESRKRQRN